MNGGVWWKEEERGRSLKTNAAVDTRLMLNSDTLASLVESVGADIYIGLQILR